MNNKLFYAQDIAEQIGGKVTANRVGRVAKKLNLKIDPTYGKWVIEFTGMLNVSVFLYNEAAVKILKEYIFLHYKELLP